MWAKIKGFFSKLWGGVDSAWDMASPVLIEYTKRFGKDFIHDLWQFAIQMVKEMMKPKYGSLTGIQKSSVVRKQLKAKAIEIGKGVVSDNDTGLDSLINTIIPLVYTLIKMTNK